MLDASLLQRNRNTIKQLLRYALVGFSINTVGYLVYLLITFLGLEPKITVTLLYFIAAYAGFWGHRRVTFDHRGSARVSGARYIVAHCLGYLLNLALLVVFVDTLGYAHQLVQFIAIFVVAAFLFLMFKFYVYRDTDKMQADVE